MTAALVSLIALPSSAFAQQDTDHVTAPSKDDWTKPQPSFEIQPQIGVQGATGGLADSTHPGPTTQIRAAYDAFQWIGIGGNYSIASATSRGGVYGDATLVNHQVYGDVRLTGPFGMFKPYAFVGFGYGWNRVRADGPTLLSNTQAPILPIGIGANFMVSKSWSLGPQATYVRSLSGSTDPVNSGDTWNVGVSGTYQMQL